MDAEEHAARRAAITAELRRKTGIDDAMIETLVHGFYDRVRADAVLGPVFAEKITDWGPHLRQMCAFWSSVALLSGVYHGRPMQKHVTLPIDAAHFDRWLELFRSAAQDLCPPEAAAYFIERAEQIARSLEAGVATVAGKPIGPGERYRDPALHGTGK